MTTLIVKITLTLTKTIIITIIIIKIIIIIIIIHLTMKITQDTSITQEIQCSYLGIVLLKVYMATC